MEPIKQEKLEAMVRFNKSQSLRKAIKLLIPIPIFSILFSHYNSWIQQPIFHCTSLFNSTSMINLLDYINREVVFLFCNLILVFLAKDSGLICFFSAPNDFYDEFLVGRGGSNSSSDTIVAVHGDHDDDDDKTVETSVGSWEVAVADEQTKEREEEGDGCICTDDMNKRFDEFIEKFKRERRLEALHLVVV